MTHERFGGGLLVATVFVVLAVIVYFAFAPVEDRRCRRPTMRDIEITVIAPGGLSYTTAGTERGCDWYEVRL